MDTWIVSFSGIGILLITVISAALGLQVTISQPTYEVARGDDVTITCNFQPKRSVNQLIIISWTGDRDGSFDDEGIIFGAFYSNDNHIDINAMYKGKARIESDVNAKVSKLFLKQVTLRERRNIRCFVQIPGDTEGQTSAVTSLLVLIAPTDPVCKIKGAAEYGQNISLTCVSEEGSPEPTYQWQSYDVKNIPRPFPPKSTEKDGVLSLFNVSIDTSGYYICTSANKIHSAKCNLTLSVMPPTLKIGNTVIIIGVAVIAIAVLVLIIYCCCRDKKQPEDFGNEPPEIKYHDIPKKEEEEDGTRDVRKTSVEGHIDQKERYEMRPEKDSDRNSNQQLNYDDHQETERYDPERHNRRREIGSRDPDEDSRKHFDDHKQPYNDKQDHSDDRQNRYGGHRDHFSDRQDRYNDHKDDYNNRQDRFDDRGDRYNYRQDNYSNSNQRERYDDGRGHYRQDPYDDDKNRFDDRRGDYDDRQGRYDNHRYHYDDRQAQYNDHRDRDEHQDQYIDHRDH